jgi:hypothetical protein
MNMDYFTAFVAAILVYVLVSGKYWSRSGRKYTRAENPLMYWGSVVAYSATLVALIGFRIYQHLNSAR